VYGRAVKVYDHPSIHSITLPVVMQALSDPWRIAIIRDLIVKNRPLACNEVPLDVSKATRSHHFEVLRNAGLIATEVEGTKCMSSLRKQEIDKKYPGLLELVLREKS
jgi:DNA-binding transcriptional ArsR family regulator